MSLWEMTLTGGIMIIVITILRAVFLNKFPKKTFLFLWEITMFRLIIPFSLPDVMSVYSLFKLSGNLDKPTQTIPEINIINIPIITDLKANDNFQVTENLLQETVSSENSISIWSIIWIVGMLLTFTVFLVGYIIIYRKYRYAIIIKDGYAEKWLSKHKLHRNVKIYSSEHTSSPLTYGIFRPIILLPESVKNEQSEQLTYILTHEMTHIRRLDMARKIAIAIVFCVHWFNPLVWVLFLLYNRDIELVCDETVVRKMGGDCRSTYALILIGMEEKQKGFSSLYIHFNKNAIEERIVAVMKTKKTGVISTTAAFALILSITFIFAALSSANAEKNDIDVSGIDAAVLMDAETGEIYYSFDNGETFLKQDDSDIYIQDVEWWTYDEYKLWLDEEKSYLQSCLGEKERTSDDGYFIWTQEKIDEAIAMYEEILEKIKKGEVIMRIGNDYSFLFKNMLNKSKIGNLSGSIKISDLSSKAAKKQLISAGIDINSKQYKAVASSLRDADDGRMYTNIQGIKNRMSQYDKDGNFTAGGLIVPGMVATGIPESERHQIINISETARQDMFDNTKREFIQEYGVANGDTTKRSEVFKRYQLSEKVENRLKGSWTLGEYERAYRSALVEAVKEADPKWEPGKAFDTNLLKDITRESVENRIVQNGNKFSLKPKNNLDMKV